MNQLTIQNVTYRDGLSLCSLVKKQLSNPAEELTNARALEIFQSIQTKSYLYSKVHSYYTSWAMLCSASMCALGFSIKRELIDSTGLTTNEALLIFTVYAVAIGGLLGPLRRGTFEKSANYARLAKQCDGIIDRINSAVKAGIELKYQIGGKIDLTSEYNLSARDRDRVAMEDVLIGFFEAQDAKV